MNEYISHPFKVLKIRRCKNANFSSLGFSFEKIGYNSAAPRVSSFARIFDDGPDFLKQKTALKKY